MNASFAIRLCARGLFVGAVFATACSSAAGSVVATSPVELQEQPREGSVGQDEARGSFDREEDAARRWERMDDGRRAEMKRRFEQFRSLDESQREALRERARSLRAERGELREQLSPDDLHRLERLEPFEREDAMRRHHEELVRERGERMRAILPRSVIDDLERLRPEERPRALRDWVRGLRDRHLDKALRRAAEGVDLPAGELERLLEQPAEAKTEALREIVTSLEGARPPWDRGAHHAPPPMLAEQPELLRELSELARPRIEDSVGTDGLDRRERKRAIAELAHGRVIERAAASGRLTPEDLQALGSIEPRDLLRSLRGAGRRPRPFDPGMGPGRPGEGRPPHFGEHGRPGERHGREGEPRWDDEPGSGAEGARPKGPPGRDRRHGGGPEREGAPPPRDRGPRDGGGDERRSGPRWG